MTGSRTPLAIAAGVSALLLGFAMGAGVARADPQDPPATKGQVSSQAAVKTDAPAAHDQAVAATAAGLPKGIEAQDTTREEEGESCNHD